jgi:GTP cyclohydrolase I
MKNIRKRKLENLFTELISELGEDPNREGLRNTSKRVVEVFDYITVGYKQNLKTIVNDAIFLQENNSMVVIKDIELYSTCEHHLLPFFGKCHIGYIAKGKVLGVSKLARIVDMFARRLQMQERLTEEIAHAVKEVLSPVGVGVVIEAQHFCMMMRGVEKQNSVMITSSLLGSFRSNLATREEFLSMIGKHG